MFLIVLSILFLKCALAVPVQQPKISESWSKLKEQKSLQRFNSTLLNEKLLPFLNDCYTEQESNSRELVTCALYFDALLQLNSTNFVVQEPAVIKVANEVSAPEEDFCSQTNTFPATKYYQNVTQPVDWSRGAVCGFFCLDMKKIDSIQLRPICKFLAWLGGQIIKTKEVPTTPASVHHDASPAQDPPILKKPEKTEKKPDVIVDKPALAPATNNIQTVDNSHISPAKPEVKNDSQIRAPAVKAKPASTLPAASAAESVPLDDHKEEKSPLETNTKSSKEIASPALHTNTQEDVQTNVEKQESISNDQPILDETNNDTDSEGDMNEDLNQEDDDNFANAGNSNPKLKPKPVPIEPSESESNRKTSQETVDNTNYFPANVNHGTDPFLEESGSNFFTYFLMGMFLCIVLYVIYHNKTKILALLLEGRRGDKGRSGRRKHTAAYRKLDSNLEEAITSSASGRTTQIIY